jgi:hypothetical protein
MIEEYPLAYVQHQWVRRGIAWLRNVFYTVPKERLEEACGTTFCRAGWMAQIVDGRATTQGAGLRAARLLGVVPSARKGVVHWYHPLGIDLNHVEKEFAEDVRQLFAHSAVPESLRPGSRAYVKAGANGLRKFMEKHEARLKATKIPPKKARKQA